MNGGDIIEKNKKLINGDHKKRLLKLHSSSAEPNSA